METITIFVNEKRFQEIFNLRQRPERFNSKEIAIRFAKSCFSTNMVVYLGENSDNLTPGYYVVCPTDFERLEREAEGIFQYISLWS